MKKPTKKWRKMQPIYRHFGGDSDKLDYSEEAACEMFTFESIGEGNLSLGVLANGTTNGYFVGKHWMDVTIKMWLADLRGENTHGFPILFLDELYSWYPEWHWWLDKVVKEPYENRF